MHVLLFTVKNHKSKNLPTPRIHSRASEAAVKADRLRGLLENLQAHGDFPHALGSFQLLETHISYVLQTGEYAYKFKKPVNLGFLDFSTLEKRRFYCHEELRLNRRLAPQLYLDVVAIYGSQQHPAFEGMGSPIEYAVKMRQFPDRDRLDRVAERGELTGDHIDELAHRVAAFHRQLPGAKLDSLYGTPGRIGDRMLQNFQQIDANLVPAIDLPLTRTLEEWTRRALRDYQDDLEIRRQQGCIRECHGDMHLANMVMLDGCVTLFDCLEFAEDLRWIDTLNEIAFLIMDLDYRGLPELARRFLDRYLEATSDYLGLTLLAPYLVYRAMVRAKVAAISLYQHRDDARQSEHFASSFTEHLRLAQEYTQRPRQAPIVITHGLSGSGKSHIVEQLVEAMGGIRVRSDVERKRLLGAHLPAARGEVEKGAYTPEITRRTYERLLALAYAIADAGYPVLVDATFLQASQRMSFIRLARTARLPLVILDVHASDTTLRARISERARQQNDPSEATLEVLDHQIRAQEPLTPDEVALAIRIDSESSLDIQRVAAKILSREALGSS